MTENQSTITELYNGGAVAQVADFNAGMKFAVDLGNQQTVAFLYTVLSRALMTNGDLADYIEKIKNSTPTIRGYISSTPPNDPGVFDGYYWYNYSVVDYPPTVFPWGGLKVYKGGSWIPTSDAYTPQVHDYWDCLDKDIEYYWANAKWNISDTSGDGTYINRNAAGLLTIIANSIGWDRLTTALQAIIDSKVPLSGGDMTGDLTLPANSKTDGTQAARVDTVAGQDLGDFTFLGEADPGSAYGSVPDGSTWFDLGTAKARIMTNNAWSNPPSITLLNGMRATGRTTISTDKDGQDNLRIIEARYICAAVGGTGTWVLNHNGTDSSTQADLQRVDDDLQSTDTTVQEIVEDAVSAITIGEYTSESGTHQAGILGYSISGKLIDGIPMYTADPADGPLPFGDSSPVTKKAVDTKADKIDLSYDKPPAPGDVIDSIDVTDITTGDLIITSQGIINAAGEVTVPGTINQIIGSPVAVPYKSVSFEVSQEVSRLVVTTIDETQDKIEMSDGSEITAAGTYDFPSLTQIAVITDESGTLAASAYVVQAFAAGVEYDVLEVTALAVGDFIQFNDGTIVNTIIQVTYNPPKEIVSVQNPTGLLTAACHITVIQNLVDVKAQILDGDLSPVTSQNKRLTQNDVVNDFSSHETDRPASANTMRQLYDIITSSSINAVNAFIISNGQTPLGWRIICGGDNTALFAYSIDYSFNVLAKSEGVYNDTDGHNYTEWNLADDAEIALFCISSDDVPVGDPATFDTGVKWVRAYPKDPALEGKANIDLENVTPGSVTDSLMEDTATDTAGSEPVFAAENLDFTTLKQKIWRGLTWLNTHKADKAADGYKYGTENMIAGTQADGIYTFNHADIAMRRYPAFAVPTLSGKKITINYGSFSHIVTPSGITITGDYSYIIDHTAASPVISKVSNGTNITATLAELSSEYYNTALTANNRASIMVKASMRLVGNFWRYEITALSAGINAITVTIGAA